MGRASAVGRAGAVDPCRAPAGRRRRERGARAVLRTAGGTHARRARSRRVARAWHRRQAPSRPDRGAQGSASPGTDGRARQTLGRAPGHRHRPRSRVTLRIGTRRSPLALAQADEVRRRLAEHGVDSELVPMATSGDEGAPSQDVPGGLKGLFVDTILDALERGTIDIAVHSAKDLPAEEEDGLVIGAVPERADAADVLVLREPTLPSGAVIGTSSVRRRAQLLRAFPGVTVEDSPRERRYPSAEGRGRRGGCRGCSLRPGSRAWGCRREARCPVGLRRDGARARTGSARVAGNEERLPNVDGARGRSTTRRAGRRWRPSVG